MRARGFHFSSDWDWARYIKGLDEKRIPVAIFGPYSGGCPLQG
jgi:hypothetical protein